MGVGNVFEDAARLRTQRDTNMYTYKQGYTETYDSHKKICNNY